MRECGNAGIIQCEAVEPYAFPQDPKTLLRLTPNRSIDIRYRPSGVVAAAGPLLEYWINSSPARYAKIVPQYASLIMQSTSSHAPMIEAAAAQSLVNTRGWLELYRDARALQRREKAAQQVRYHYGVEFAAFTRPEVTRMQPHLSSRVTDAIHWQNAWTVASPGDLVQAYPDLFVAAGGRLHQAEITDIRRTRASWWVSTTAGALEAPEVVLALEPWSGDWAERLGYRLPLFVKRGYHMHYAPDLNRPLQHWLMDAERGYLVEPMTHGIRLTTGAELARRDSQPQPAQLAAAEHAAREPFPSLGERLDAAPWHGARPCTADMKPIIGPAPHDAGLWFAFGHGHQGFTLGPVTIIACMMNNATPPIDPRPFSPARFL